MDTGTLSLQIAYLTATLVQGVDRSPELFVEIDSEDWIAIVEGRLSGTQAYMSGKMKVKGDMNLLPILKQLFPPVKVSSDKILQKYE